MRKLAWTAWALAMLAVAPDLSARESSRAKEVPVRNVIYMIGDGMGLTHVSMMMLEEGYRPTSFDRSQNVALITTYSANNRVTDSAAAGTALASGRKTNNGMLGMTPDGETFESMMEKAMDEGWKAGLVVTVYLQHATPAAFYAHVPSRNDLDEISEQFVESGVDVAFGGGRKFLAADRGDGKTLIDELKAKDYRVVYDLQEADRGPVLGGVHADRTERARRELSVRCDEKSSRDSDEQCRKERRLPADGRRLADRLGGACQQRSGHSGRNA